VSFADATLAIEMDAAIWTVISLLAATSLGSLFYLGSRIDGLGSRIDGLGTRMDGLGDRIDALGARLDTRLDAMESRIDAHMERHAAG
jgi:hypothetical protein